METGQAFIFDGSFDGFLTIVHGYYYEKWRPEYVFADGFFQQTLGTEYIYVATDADKAATVHKAICKKISNSASATCFAAFLSENPDIYLHMLNYIVTGFKVGRAVDDHMHIDGVLKVLKTSQNVMREAHFHKEFCRFSETKDNVLYADISPKTNVLPLLADHFSNRLISLPWVVHDVTRSTALIYDTKECLLCAVPKDVNIVYSDVEEHYQDLWHAFFKSITNESRRSYKLQRQMMPLHYREHMTEFKQKLRDL